MKKKLYEVVGDSIVHGFKKGEQFEAALKEFEEDLLTVSGHLKVVKKAEAETPAANKEKVNG